MAAPGDLCTQAEVLAALSAPADPDLAMIDRLISAASAALMRAAGREFATLDVDEVVTDTGGTDENTTYVAAEVIRRFIPPANHTAGGRLHVGDMAAAPSLVDIVTVDGEVIESGLTVECVPLNRRPWQPVTAIALPVAVSPSRRVDVTSTWGFPEVPPDVRQACVAQVREWYVRDPSRFSDAFLDADGGVDVPSRELSLVARDAVRAYRVPVVA